MTALTAPRKYTFERDGITKFPASSASCKEGSLIAFRPSTGYAVKWDGTADDEFVGVATKNHDSVSEIEVRTNPMVVRGYAGSSDGPHGGITVTGSSAVTDNGKPVYATDDNVLTLTANSADPVGEVVKWISGALCWVRLIPSGTNRTSAGATDVTLGDNLAAAYVIKEGSNSYLTFVTTDSGEKMTAGKSLTMSSGTTLSTNTIAETTSALGVHIDSLGVQDGRIHDVRTVSAKTTVVTLTIAELLTGIITGTHAAGADQAYTLPLGTDCEAARTWATNETFEWSLVNLSGTPATNTITITANTGHTIVGPGVVVGSATAALNTRRCLTRRSAANTFITYVL